MLFEVDLSDLDFRQMWDLVALADFNHFDGGIHMV